MDACRSCNRDFVPGYYVVVVPTLLPRPVQARRTGSDARSRALPKRKRTDEKIPSALSVYEEAKLELEEQFECGRARLKSLCHAGIIQRTHGKTTSWLVSEMMRPRRLVVRWMDDNKYPLFLEDTLQGGMVSLPIQWMEEDGAWAWRDISKQTGVTIWLVVLYRTMAFCWGSVGRDRLTLIE
jgi:hypothetical protein